jgi:uncharacterized protein YbbC (DUF1343 family)
MASLSGGLALASCARGAVTLTPGVAAVRPGIDVLLTDSLHLVRGKRVGFVTNVAAVDRLGASAINRMRNSDFQLMALFGPEHGLSAQAAPGEKVASATDSTSNIPIYSLYGATRRPTAEMMAGLDVIVVDLPDVGTRYYTYPATTVEVMFAAHDARIPVIVLDRPNPLGGIVEGNLLDPAHSSMVGRLAVPMRHGLTLGELARLARADLNIDVALTVVPVAGWRPTNFFGDLNLPFRAPSPNLRDLDALFHYPGTCLFEGTALSVGRGTDHPFHQVGAPWLDTTAVLLQMRQLQLPGVQFEGVTFTPQNPGDAKHAGVTVAGIRLRIIDHRTYEPVRTAIHLLSVIRKVHPDQINIGGIFDKLAGGPTLREAILRGDAPEAIVASWGAPQAAYLARRQPALLY